MSAQRIITKKYRDELLQDVKNEVGLDRYTQETFPIDNTRVGYSRNVEAPKGLLEMMDPGDDLISGIAIYGNYIPVYPK